MLLTMAILASVGLVASWFFQASGGWSARLLTTIVWAGMILAATAVSVAIEWIAILSIIGGTLLDAVATRMRSRCGRKTDLHLLHRGVGSLLMVPCLLNPSPLPAAVEVTAHAGHASSIHALLTALAVPYVIASACGGIRMITRSHTAEHKLKVGDLLGNGSMTAMVALLPAM